MQRFGRWLMMTVRWLLVAVLPVVGMLVGLWLVPENKPRWERTLSDITECAGVLVDGENTCLLTYGQRHYENEVQTHQIVSGLSLKTGEELFTGKVPARSHDEVQLVPGTFMALCKSHDSHNSIMLYDWKNQTELHLQTQMRISRLLTAMIKNNVVAVVAAGIPGNQIIFWRLDSNLASETNQLNEVRMALSLQLSSSGAWAIIRYRHTNGSPPSPAVEIRVEVFDTKRGSKVQSLPTNIGHAFWLTEDDAFLAMHYEQAGIKQHWQKYIRENDSFVPSGSAIFLPRRGLLMPQSPGPYVVMASSNELDPLWHKAMSFLGKQGESLLKSVWKQGTTLDVYRASTGELLESLVIPGLSSSRVFAMVDGRKTIHPDPNGHGLVLHDGKTISYWGFHAASRWYSWIGLGVGLVLSILVARWNLRGAVRRGISRPVGA